MASRIKSLRPKFLRLLGYTAMGLCVMMVSVLVWSFWPRSHWELNLHDEDENLAFTLIEKGGSRARTVVFDEVLLGMLKPRFYRLPEEVDGIEGAKLEFSDITLRPGRVRFTFRSHIFDIMSRALIIDEREYLWNAPAEVHLTAGRDVAR